MHCFIYGVFNRTHFLDRFLPQKVNDFLMNSSMPLHICLMQDDTENCFNLLNNFVVFVPVYVCPFHCLSHTHIFQSHKWVIFNWIFPAHIFPWLAFLIIYPHSGYWEISLRMSRTPLSFKMFIAFCHKAACFLVLFVVLTKRQNVKR